MKPSTGRPFLMDPQTHALLEAMDHFNALPETERRGDGAWLTFGTIKGCARGVGAQLDAYLESNDVVVPPALGVTLLESESGELTLLPRCEGLPDEAFAGSFLRARDGQSLYHLDAPDGRKLRVVFGESQRQALERMRKVRRLKGPMADQIRARPDVAFEGLLDVVDPHYARRVQGVGDWKPQPIPKDGRIGPSLLDAEGLDLEGDDTPVDLAWPKLRGGLETPVTVEVPRPPDPEPLRIPLDTPEEAAAFVEAMRKAQSEGEPEFSFRGESIGVDGELLESLEGTEGRQRPKSKKFLLIYTDEEVLSPLDEAEVERAVLVPDDLNGMPAYEAPKALLASTRLKPHQEEGVAWLQGCIRSRPHRRGALLADEMGLGKSLEVLTFAAWCLEKEVLDGFHSGPGPYRPMLLVAPLMLVENETWQQDMRKFFDAHAFGPILTLYGDQLQALRRGRGKETEVGVPLLDLDRIRQHRVVITNYDTLTNFQHSFAQAGPSGRSWLRMKPRPSKRPTRGPRMP